MISVRGLSKHYGKTEVLKDISFEVQKGDIVGLLGQNGAGKTTLMRIITGYLPANEGDMLINGMDIIKQPIEVKKLIGYLPENCPLYPEMTVEGFLLSMGEFKGLYGKKLKERLLYVLDAVKIKDRRKQIIANLSKGYKQRVGLAQALIHDPELLILDEPTVGLDPNQIVEIRDLIKNLKGDRTIILSSHILPEVSQTCQKIIIISQGNIVAQGKEEDLVGNLSKNNTLYLRLGSKEQEACDLLSSFSGVKSSRIVDSVIEVDMAEGSDIRADIAYLLVQNKFSLLEMKREEMTLEKIFISLTQKQ